MPHVAGQSVAHVDRPADRSIASQVERLGDAGPGPSKGSLCGTNRPGRRRSTLLCPVRLEQVNEAQVRQTGSPRDPHDIADASPPASQETADTGFTDRGDVDGHRSGAEIASDDRSVVGAGGILEAAVKRAEIPRRNVAREHGRHEQHTWTRAHGREIADADGHCPLADLTQGHPRATEVHALHLGIHGQHRGSTRSRPPHGRVVADRHGKIRAARRRGLTCAQPVDPGELLARRVPIPLLTRRH